MNYLDNPLKKINRILNIQKNQKNIKKKQIKKLKLNNIKTDNNINNNLNNLNNNNNIKNIIESDKIDKNSISNINNINNINNVKDKIINNNKDNSNINNKSKEIIFTNKLIKNDTIVKTDKKNINDEYVLPNTEQEKNVLLNTEREKNAYIKFKNLNEKLKYFNINFNANNVINNNDKYKEISFENLKSKLIYITKNKKGLEIGGPSIRNGQLIYNNNLNLDNTILDEKFRIEKYTNNNFYNKIYLNDNIDLFSINDKIYDFVFSSNCLEHIANPIKAIKESLRVLKNEGFLIIIVPDKKYTFDHYRRYSQFKEIKEAFENNIKEDDLSKLEEILKKHDLSRDRINSKFDIFKEKCLNNFQTRIIHHFVYNFDLFKEICLFLNEYIEELYYCQNHVDLWFVIKKK